MLASGTLLDLNLPLDPSNNLYVSQSVLSDFSRLAHALALNPTKLLSHAGLDHRILENPDLPIPMQNFVELLEVSALAAETEDFGLRLAKARGLPDLGPLSLLIREQASVRDAIRTLTRSLYLHSNAVYVSLEDDNSPPVVTVEIITQGATSCRQAAEMAIAGVTELIRWLLGEEWSPKGICFVHGPPASKTSHSAFFRCPVHFRFEFNAIVLRNEDIDQPLQLSSPVLSRQVERFIESIDRHEGDDLVYRVTQLVAATLPHGGMNAANIAKYFGTSRRTLNRWLSQYNLCFSTIVDRVRTSLSAQHLLGSDKPLTEISGILGFTNLSSFSRWHRKVFGVSPAKWRKQQKAGMARGASNEMD